MPRIRCGALVGNHGNKYSVGVQLGPVNSNCQGKLQLLRVIRVSSYRGFEQKDQKHLIKVVLCLYMFYCKIFRNVRANKNDKTIQKHKNHKYYKVTALQNV